ncbi:hypothetical protein DYD21_18615 [Rhodohalobacter sp. SW132]|uniref:hypothetical protein n=1 Tax=Rhodohalobacter sp. SW132 TaxID=2293433 RepID=UPI000E22BF05|nr:hypothetical protein [Rhodohalobacter sp. SW132]REL24224.1 hypothetical protein DYD21_18615 [Rhodohalobacter sp. SW132]
MKNSKKKEKDTIHSDIRDSIISFEDLIQNIKLQEDFRYEFDQYFNSEQGKADISDIINKCFSENRFTKLDDLLFEKYYPNDEEYLKTIIKNTFNSFKNILESSPERIYHIMVDQTDIVRILSDKILRHHENFNHVLCGRKKGAQITNSITQEKYFKLLNNEHFVGPVISENTMNDDEFNKLSDIFRECIKLHRDIKVRYTTLQVLPVLSNKYEDHLFNHKMNDLTDACLGVFIDESNSKKENKINILTKEGRYNAYKKLRENYSRKKSLEILDLELTIRHERGINELDTSHDTFLNAYDQHIHRENERKRRMAERKNKEQKKK